MTLFYNDIKNKNTVFIDSREKERGIRFKKHLDNFLDSSTKSKLEEMDVLKEKRETGRTYSEVSNLEYGDYAFNDVVVEFKNYEDFKTSIRDGSLTTQVEDLYMHSDFKDTMLVIICDDPIHFMNEGAQWKGIVRFNSKTNVFLAKDEERAFEAICHFFWLNGKHVTQAPRTKMRKNDNYAANFLWASRALSDKQIRQIVKTYKLSTKPHAEKLFLKDSPDVLYKEFKEKNIKGVTVKRISKVVAFINGDPLF